MDLVALVERARAGDVDAFTELVRRHQDLALGSAVALLRNPDLARDVVQESFVAAWRGLARLAEPKAFPAWLHGIVRRQAFHVLRARHLEPLAEAEHLAGDTLPADQQMEAARRRTLALSALADLPDGLREPAVLRYVHDCSHAQIAAFLGLPVTTVNNRLHAARVRIKRRMLVMVKDALTDRTLPEDFPARIGRIVRAEGPVVEARFEPAGPPQLTIARARKLRLFFAQPFFIAEPYTKRPGAFVPHAEAIAACKAILDGVYDDIPEDAFYFVGGIDEVLAKAGRAR